MKQQTSLTQLFLIGKNLPKIKKNKQLSLMKRKKKKKGKILTSSEKVVHIQPPSPLKII